ncbi:unnamed protein product [Timema podura]|uniref:Uncharacterized protein n=1 Tax=Timema podura TaxID=61482 RepID=A0ABN7NJS2_TIMPD|nr:unnamed protein product [Timema podura]
MYVLPEDRINCTETRLSLVLACEHLVSLYKFLSEGIKESSPGFLGSSDEPNTQMKAKICLKGYGKLREPKSKWLTWISPCVPVSHPTPVRNELEQYEHHAMNKSSVFKEWLAKVLSGLDAMSTLTSPSLVSPPTSCTLNSLCRQVEETQSNGEKHRSITIHFRTPRRGKEVWGSRGKEYD